MGSGRWDVYVWMLMYGVLDRPERGSFPLDHDGKFCWTSLSSSLPRLSFREMSGHVCGCLSEGGSEVCGGTEGS